MPEAVLVGSPARTKPFGLRAIEPAALDNIEGIAGAALLLEPGESPHAIGYRLFLEGVPVRIGRSTEFGGLSLSRRFAPGAPDAELVQALLEACA